jgi:polar amino acid transport system substrate-binding protein
MRLLTCCLLWCAAALAQAGCGEITVAYYDHGALYSRDPAGQWHGVDKDVVEELGRRSGCKFKGYVDSRVRIWTSMKSGALDMTVSGIPTPEREKFAHFIPYLGTRNYVLVAKDVSVRTMDEFLANPALKIAVVRSFLHGEPYESWLEKLRSQGRVYEASDYSGIIRLLQIGRVQAVLALPTSWVPILRREGMTGDVRIMDWADDQSVIGALVLSRKRIDPATVSVLKKHMKDMLDDGTMKAIYTRHLGAELAPALLPR